jgi:hypothetical protein
VMDMNNVIRLSDALYRAVTREAAVRQRTPDEFAEELLARHLLPQHPHVEVVESRSGPRAVVRGTHVGADVVVGCGRCLPEANDGTAGRRSICPSQVWQGLRDARPDRFSGLACVGGWSGMGFIVLLEGFRGNLSGLVARSARRWDGNPPTNPPPPSVAQPPPVCYNLSQTSQPGGSIGSDHHRHA